MGFDMTVILNCPISYVSGLPYRYDNSGALTQIPYEPQDFVVPEKYRKYMDQRGSHFHAYIKSFGELCCQTSVDVFLHYYPKWEDVQAFLEKEGLGDDWVLADHEGFKEALHWMSSTNIFGLSWSY